MPEEKNNLIGNVTEKVGFKVSLMPKESKAPSPKQRLFLFYLIFFIGCGFIAIVSGSLWLTIFLKQEKINAGNSSLAAINKKITDLGSSFDAAKKEQQTLNILSDVLNNHIYSSKVFDWLEADTLPQVSWNNLSFTSGGNFSLAGTASSYEMLVAQVETIKDDPMITAVSFSGVNADFDENNVMKGVNFNLNVALNPAYLNKK
jgi:Tfp pilus assembly protein PilN